VKLYRYIYKIALLILFPFLVNAQIIDGKAYTPFNNYYKWRGGVFDTTLLIPNVASNNGKRPGALYYNTIDSSVYSWTGSQWRRVTGSSLPSLQQVTDIGNITNDSVRIINNSGNSLVDIGFIPFGNRAGSITLYNRNDGGSYLYTEPGSIAFYRNQVPSSYTTSILPPSLPSRNSSLRLPDTTANLSVGVSINGSTYIAGTNGIVSLGNTDTATVVKAYVTNAEAFTITKGQVVYIYGASGDRASVRLAKNTSDTFSSKTLGIVRADIASGAAGWITTQGQVSGINLGAYTAGDILWLDSIPGGYTATKPQAPYHAVFVGVVERANAGNGLIYVKPQNGVELDELHDVRITSVANNEIIRYNSSLGYWENKSIVTTLGYTPLNVTDTTAMLSPYLRSNVAAATYATISQNNAKVNISDTAAMLSPYLRSNVANATYQLQLDTVPIAVFGAGSGAAGDTAAFSTSAVYGSFYNAGSDTLIITQMRAGVLGTSPNITTEVYWNDSLNITAGATILVTGGTSVTGTIGATNVTSFTNNKIPPNVWVFVRTSAVATKPTYFTLTLLGYKKRI
jgi:hypothetical protein